jgi:cyclic pyranopterin monophosphate synthase
MKKKKLSHVDPAGNPAMVDISEKEITKRKARAQAVVYVGKEILSHLKNDDIHTKKGPVFQTAILAGIMASKKTGELIPLCHPLGLDSCDVKITTSSDAVIINTSASLSARTGVEMEALVAASIAALTVYDMCKALSHDIVIREIKLLEKSGGKKDFKRE